MATRTKRAGVAEARDSEPPRGAPAIRLAGLWREFSDRVVLEDVDVELDAGGTLVVIGPNGAGKTTLLRILATLLRPTGGEVMVLGARLPRESWRARGRIGFLGHEPLLYRDLTVAENLRFCSRLHGVESAGDRIGALLDRVGMSRRADELARNLSAGMAQRVAACRAVLHEPELLLLDEPGAHLDPQAAQLVDPLIGSREGRTRVVVTHDFRAALSGDARVLALGHGGAVAYEGPPGGLSAAAAEAIYAGAPR